MNLVFCLSLSFILTRNSILDMKSFPNKVLVKCMCFCRKLQFQKPGTSQQKNSFVKKKKKSMTSSNYMLQAKAFIGMSLGQVHYSYVVRPHADDPKWVPIKPLQYATPLWILYMLWHPGPYNSPFSLFWQGMGNFKILKLGLLITSYQKPHTYVKCQILLSDANVASKDQVF